MPYCKIKRLDNDDFHRGVAIVTILPGDFEIECSSIENRTNIGRSCSLTREQVLWKIGIAMKGYEGLADDSQKGTSIRDDDERSNDEEDPQQECTICMEGFKIGDKISFSPFEGCNHVFHHDCVRRWLLGKTDCPCCRVTMLPVDRLDPKNCGERGYRPRTRREWKQLLRTRSSHAMKLRYHKNAIVLRERLNKKCSFCCVACGVVVLKTHLREDLCTKITPTQGTSTAEVRSEQ